MDGDIEGGVMSYFSLSVFFPGFPQLPRSCSLRVFPSEVFLQFPLCYLNVAPSLFHQSCSEFPLCYSLSVVAAPSLTSSVLTSSFSSYSTSSPFPTCSTPTTSPLECRQFNNCPKTPTRLTLPLLPPCVPAPLSNTTFRLSPPPHGTVELTPSSLSGPLRQALPDQPCSPGSLVVKVAEEGSVLGHFCPGGAIMRMQIHTGTVTLTVAGTAGRVVQGPVMSVLIKEAIAGDEWTINCLSLVL